MSEQTIEIDCAPGDPRPDTYLQQVIEGTPLTYKEPYHKFFGNWTWDYSDIDASIWEQVRPTLKERIIALYKAGHIRYGSW